MKASINDFIRWAESNGWRRTRTGGDHFRWVHPDVPQPVYTASTTKSQTGLRNAQSLMRRLMREAGRSEAA